MKNSVRDYTIEVINWAIWEYNMKDMFFVLLDFIVIWRGCSVCYKRQVLALQQYTTNAQIWDFVDL